MNKTKYLNITSLMLQIFVIALLFLDGVFVFDGWSEASFYYVYSTYGDRIKNTPATLFMATIIAMIILSILQLTSNKVFIVSSFVSIAQIITFFTYSDEVLETLMGGRYDSGSLYNLLVAMLVATCVLSLVTFIYNKKYTVNQTTKDN